MSTPGSPQKVVSPSTKKRQVAMKEDAQKLLEMLQNMVKEDQNDSDDDSEMLNEISREVREAQGNDESDDSDSDDSNYVDDDIKRTIEKVCA